MAYKGYSRKGDPEETAKAIGREMPISKKHAVEICRHLRNMPLDQAKDELNHIISMDKPLRFKKYSGSAGHRKGKGFGPGRYPQKACKAILKALENAESNAEQKGLPVDEMVIWHIAATSGMTCISWERWAPNVSKAPHLTRASRRRLFMAWQGTLMTKSWKSVKGPVFFRSLIICFTAASPTFLMPASPKRILSPTAVKFTKDSLTSGGSMGMPISLHTPR